MRPDPDHGVYLAQWGQAYERNNYGASLAGRLLHRSHVWAERPFGPTRHFPLVLEVGAGAGHHLGAVRHGFDRYCATDLDINLLALGLGDRAAADPRIELRAEDATRLSFSDASVDRLIAAHVLEHLPEPQRVLREWWRVLKPGGVLTLVLPADPGMAWRLGRHFGPRRRFKATGQPYDYWMAREHVNPINNLVALLRYYFDRIDDSWWPLRVPSMDLNLFYIAHITVPERTQR